MSNCPNTGVPVRFCTCVKCKAPERPPSLEQILERWAEQPGAVVTPVEWAFIEAMRVARRAGVGYGWMRQVIAWEWAHHDGAAVVV